MDDPEILALLGDDADGSRDEGDAGAESDEDEKAAEKKKQEEEEDKEAVGSVDKAKNWSAVNLVFQESKLNYRGVFSAIAFTNWMWYRCVRPKLEETKSKLPEIDAAAYCIDDVEEIMGEFMPAVKVDKD